MTSHHDPPDDTAAYVNQRLAALAKLHGRQPEPQRWALYTARLERFPLFALSAAFDAAEVAEGAWYPSLGEIIARVRHALQERGILEAPDAAFHRARREVSRLCPPTRTEVAFSSPAVAACIARMGGAEAFKVAIESSSDQTFDIARKEFLRHYESECLSDEHLAFVAAHGAPAVPAPVRGIELPGGEIARLVAHANANGRAIPAWLEEQGDTPALPTPRTTEEATR